ncbi:adenylyltransferase/cytidyltransferase family protein [bacterium]|jgi:pantetheine-phosphate adenylyltransferase|nr:adenylyltransferase/cytidyltransferase family protein [bacterium]
MRQLPEIVNKYISDNELNVILNHYNETHRYYHNIDHIIDMIESALFQDENFNNINVDEDLLLAILYHDIIYDPKSKNNEQKSADLFKKYHPDNDEVYNAILETDNHMPTTILSEILSKLDLEILYQDYNTFVEYEDKIFKEYQFVDYKTYKEKRIQILEDFGVESIFIDYVRNKKPKIAVYAGSFNGFHKGHLDILEKSEAIFDKVIIARGINPSKTNELVELPKSIQYRQIETYSGLLTVFIDSLSYDVTLVRGLRNATDLEYEKNQYRYLKDLKPDIKVISILSDVEYEHISSSAIRMLEKYGKGKNYLI